MNTSISEIEMSKKKSKKEERGRSERDTETKSLFQEENKEVMRNETYSRGAVSLVGGAIFKFLSQLHPNYRSAIVAC